MPAPGQHTLTDDDHQAVRELTPTPARADRGNAPQEETAHAYGLGGTWTRHPAGPCRPCHDRHQEKQEAAAPRHLEQPRAVDAKLRPRWTCRGSTGGEEDSPPEPAEVAGPNRLECPDCEKTRKDDEPGSAGAAAAHLAADAGRPRRHPARPRWNLRVRHAQPHPAKDRR